MYCPHPLGGAVCRNHTQYAAFTPENQEVAIRFLVFWCLFVHNLPKMHICTDLFLVPHSCFVYIAGEDICPGANTEVEGLGPRIRPNPSHSHSKIKQNQKQSFFSN